MALDTTVGGAAAVSYADVAYANAYFARTGRKDAWDGLGGAPAKEALLLEAMLPMDNLEFLGTRAANTQALEWPRDLVYVRGQYHYMPTVTTGWQDRRGRAWTKDAIPDPVKQAQCEYALALGLNPGILDNAQDEVTSIRTGRTTVNMRMPNQQAVFYRAKQLLRPFLAVDSETACRTMR